MPLIIYKTLDLFLAAMLRTFSTIENFKSSARINRYLVRSPLKLILSMGAI